MFVSLRNLASVVDILMELPTCTYTKSQNDDLTHDVAVELNYKFSSHNCEGRVQ